jgi:mono/diheme cytochrome c family protein
MNLPFPAAAALVAVALAATTAVAPDTLAQPGAAADPVARGRYLVAIAGCNDCHTAGFAMSNGATPEQDRLAGDTLGWQGPWGTTYGSNLRAYFQSIDEAGWIAVARTRDFRPPMPTPSIRAMTDDDLRAIRSYVRSLGPAGGPAPAYVPPGQPAKGPVVVFPAPPK